MDDLIVEKYNYDAYAICDRNIYWGVFDIIMCFNLEEDNAINYLSKYNYKIARNADIMLFENKEDALQVLEWINTLLIADQLS